MAGHYFKTCTLVFTFLLLLWQPSGVEGDRCNMTSLCVFECGDQVMNMDALKNYRFRGVPDSKKLEYFSFSPCATFNEGLGCHATHVCRENRSIKVATTNLGNTFSWSLFPHGGNSVFTYTHSPMIGKLIVTKVTLQCAPPTTKSDVPTLKIAARDPGVGNHYEMTLITRYACFQNKTTPITPTTHVTTAHTTHVTSPKSNVTTAHTTHVTSPKSNVTTAHTTHVTSPKSNVTTPEHNVTTAATTTATTLNTTSHHNLTTHLTTPSNATTQNSTTHITTPTTANLTTHVTTPSKNHTTTAHDITTVANSTSHGPSHHTTPAHPTTTHGNGASELVTSPGKALVVLLMAMMTMLASV